MAIALHQTAQISLSSEIVLVNLHTHTHTKKISWLLAFQPDAHAKTDSIALEHWLVREREREREESHQITKTSIEGVIDRKNGKTTDNKCQCKKTSSLAHSTGSSTDYLSFEDCSFVFFVAQWAMDECNFFAG
jgi:signal transduction histidine kinase